VATGTDESAAVMMFAESGRWRAELLPERLGSDLPALLATLRQQPSERGVIGLVNACDEFFVAVRVTAEHTRVLLSDVTAAVAWDLARQACDYLGVPVPSEEDLDDIWPAGDLEIFEDLGMESMEVGALLADTDAYADEQLLALVRRLGLAEPYEQVVDTESG
jgi:putative tRNA adenosine deaminase-associated protein